MTMMDIVVAHGPNIINPLSQGGHISPEERMADYRKQKVISCPNKWYLEGIEKEQCRVGDTECVYCGKKMGNLVPGGSEFLMEHNVNII